MMNTTRRRLAWAAIRWLRGAACLGAFMGASAWSQSAPPTSPSGLPGGTAGPQPTNVPQWPALPATLPPYDDGLRSIVSLAEEGRGDEALLWTLAYLGQSLPGAEIGVETAADEPLADGGVPTPSLPQLPPAPELTEAQRASLHYALAVILAGVPTSEAPVDPSAAELTDARERWALKEWARAEGLAGRGRVRADANFNRGALHTWRGERSFLTLLREVAASGGGAPPFPEDSPQREALIATRAEFAAGRDAALDGLRLGWERLAAGRKAEAGGEDLRANLEFCQRRLRQIDRLLELPPEEEPPPEQEQQEDKEDSEDSADSQESQDSEAESSQQGESNENESDEPSQQSEQDTESEGDQESDSPSENSEGTPQGSQGEPDPESLEEREPPPAEPPGSEEPDGDGEPEEQTSQEAPADGESADQAAEASAEDPVEGEVDEAQSGVGQAGQEPTLSEEQVIQLLRRLADIEEDQERLRALIRGAQRVPVEKDW